MLVPGGPQETLPFVDARDLAAWLVRVIEARLSGFYNVAGALPTMGTFIERCVARSAAPVTPVWVDATWLKGQDVFFESMPPLHSGGPSTTRWAGGTRRASRSTRWTAVASGRC